MIDPTRQELLAVLTRLSELNPEMRLGQLISNLASLCKGDAPEATWDVEDADLLTAARRQLRYFEERLQSSVA